MPDNNPLETATDALLRQRGREQREAQEQAFAGWFKSIYEAEGRPTDPLKLRDIQYLAAEATRAGLSAPDLQNDPEFEPTTERIWTFRRSWFSPDIAKGDKVASPLSIAPMWMRVVEVTDKTVKAVKL